MKTFAAGVVFCVAVALFGAAGTAFAQNSTPGRGEDLTIQLAVIGPGDELFFWWGHAALIIKDSVTGASTFYDWGAFSFAQENFFFNFAMGRLYYTCASSDAKDTIANYRAANRDITIYTLNFDEPHRAAIKAFVDNNMKPENRRYLYHHFRDNCATRIRDIIDLGTDGQFAVAYKNTPGPYTLRQEIRRCTWFNPFFDWILNFWMGRNIDKPITVWEAMFLPDNLGKRAAEFTYMDNWGLDEPLVSETAVVNVARHRPDILETPRRQWPWELLAGLVLAAVLVALPRKPFFLLQSALGAFFGLAGTLLFFLTFLTNHDYAWYNINVAFVNPLWFAAIPLGLKASRKKDGSTEKAEKALGWFWLIVFTTALGCYLSHALPGVQQQNFVTLALVMPWTGILALRHFLGDVLWAL